MKNRTSAKFAWPTSPSANLPTCGAPYVSGKFSSKEQMEKSKERQKPAAHHAAIGAEYGAAHAIAGVQRLGDVLGGAPQRARAVIAGAHVPQPRVRARR